ncbi:MAG: hypothetical protein ABIQ74_01205 [Chitinophagales bacterium]
MKIQSKSTSIVLTFKNIIRPAIATIIIVLNIYAAHSQSCTSTVDPCNLIMNSGFENGSTPPSNNPYNGIANHYAECWDISPFGCTCYDVGGFTSPDLLDANAPPASIISCYESLNSTIGIPYSFTSDGDVPVHLNGTKRYVHLKTTTLGNKGEAIYGQLAQPLAQKIYYLQFYVSPPTLSCQVFFNTSLCVRLYDHNNCNNFYEAINGTVLANAFAPGWILVNTCVTGSNLSGLDRISIQDYYGDPILVDDFLLQQLADAGPDMSLCLPGTTVLGNQSYCTIPGATYQWAPATGLSCTNCANPTCSVTTNTTYTLTVTSPTGCTATDQVTVNICSLPQPIITGDQYSCNYQSQYTVSNLSSFTLGTTFTWSFTGDGSVSSTGLLTWNTQGAGTICVTAVPPSNCSCPSQQSCFSIFACCQGDGAAPNCTVVVQNISTSALKSLLDGLGNAPCDNLPYDIGGANIIDGNNDASHEIVINGKLTLDANFTLEIFLN